MSKNFTHSSKRNCNNEFYGSSKERKRDIEKERGEEREWKRERERKRETENNYNVITQTYFPRERERHGWNIIFSTEATLF